MDNGRAMHGRLHGCKWYDYMDIGGTIPRMESVESSREQRPRAMHRYMDVTY